MRIVRESASSYEATLMKNEAATRAVLIDPVLRALGWDVADPFTVEVETVGQFGISKISADYALKASGEVIAVVEAKKLRTNLQQFHQQLVQYGFSFGIKKLFLTDGIHWEHFTGLDPGNLAPSKTFDLDADDLGQVAAYLVQELDAALVSPDEEQIEVLADKVEQLQQEVANLRSLDKRVANLEKSAPNLQSGFNVVPQQLPTPDTPWQPLEGLSGLSGTKPSKLRLPDKMEIPVKSWGQVLVEVCRYALMTNPSLPTPLPDKAGKTRTLIQRESFPQNVANTQVEVGGQTFHVLTKYDADHCVTNAVYVLEQGHSKLEQVKAAVLHS